PSPVEMVETIVNLRPTNEWPRRKINSDDAFAQAKIIASQLQQHGYLQKNTEIKDDLLQTATDAALTQFDRAARNFARTHYDAADRKKLDHDLFDFAVPQLNSILIDSLLRTARGTPITSQLEPSPQEINRLALELSADLSKRLFLWRKTKTDLQKEMDAELQ